MRTTMVTTTRPGQLRAGAAHIPTLHPASRGTHGRAWGAFPATVTTSEPAPLTAIESVLLLLGASVFEPLYRGVDLLMGNHRWFD